MNTTHRARPAARAFNPVYSRFGAPHPVFLAVLMAGAVLAACSASASADKPTDREIESQVEQQLSQASDLWEVRNLHKTNGTRNQDGTYTAEVAYDLVFKMSYESAFARAAQAQGAAVAMQGMQPLLQKFGMWAKGKTEHEDESIRFVKSEKGWVMAGDQ